MPETVRVKGQNTYRSLTVDGDEVEFSDGFTDLHTRVYEENWHYNGFGLATVRPAIELVHSLRHATPRPRRSAAHPMAVAEWDG